MDNRQFRLEQFLMLETEDLIRRDCDHFTCGDMPLLNQFRWKQKT